MSDNIVDFTHHLNLKKSKEQFKSHILSSGWTMESVAMSDASEVCVYLLDSQEKAMLTFGCAKDTFPKEGDDSIIHWGHFVQSWITIANPNFGSDAKSREITMQLARWALPSLEEWPDFESRAFNTKPGHVAHVIVIVNQEDLDAPSRLIVAHSEAKIMNVESIQAIYKGYTEDQ